jgi:phosphoenolpyruvate carboxykinase (ATP)
MLPQVAGESLRPRIDRSELATFVPELTIYCCPTFKADPKRHGVRSDTVIAIDFTKKIVLSGGSSYAGEIKKAVFTTMNYFLPAQAVMPMHCSANVGPKRCRDLLRPFGNRQNDALR